MEYEQHVYEYIFFVILTECGADPRASEGLQGLKGSLLKGTTLQKLETVLCLQNADEYFYFFCKHCNNLLFKVLLGGLVFSLYDGFVFPTVWMAIT